MKAVLISIQPKWCELIASGKKTIEVRKTRPKLETPFKCYIYCTKSKEIMFNVFLNEPEKEVEYLSGKVIGEFVCDSIRKGGADNFIQAYYHNNPDETCLTDQELVLYATIGKSLYFWHISDLKIYDKPKELGEFCVRNNHPNCDQCAHIPVGMHPQEFVWHNDFCGECSRLSYKSMWATHFRKRLARPPQSWCYVEELKR